MLASPQQEGLSSGPGSRPEVWIPKKRSSLCQRLPGHTKESLDLFQLCLCHATGMKRSLNLNPHPLGIHASPVSEPLKAVSLTWCFYNAYQNRAMVSAQGFRPSHHSNTAHYVHPSVRGFTSPHTPSSVAKRFSAHGRY